MVNLQGNPFFLGQADIDWVEDTIEGMTLEEKVGQLFCPVGFTTDERELLEMLEKGIGGIMYRTGEAKEVQRMHRFLQDHSKLPLLIAANLEAGGTGSVSEGTDYGKPMQMAATGDPEQGYRLGYVSCAEAAAVGVNWAFAPIVDIDRNWRNPITNLRTFGSEPKKVLTFAGEYLRGAKEAGVAATLKHFPGDGCDERDQHLSLTVNDLSAEEWDATYGMIYKHLIEDGARSVMVAHIAQPAWAKKLNPELSLEESYLPASLSKELLTGLLREHLGFNGLIVTDATTMLGFTTAMERRKAVPRAIEAGCDMFLFNKSFPEDYDYMMEGIASGALTLQRLDDCMRRILGMKASLGLHRKKDLGLLVPGEESLEILHSDTFAAWAKECADEAVTLVKDTQNLLPLTPERYPRIMLCVSEGGGYYGETNGLFEKLKAALEAEGFTVGEPPMGGITDKPVTVGSIREKFDAALYAFDFPTSSNNTVVRLSWKGGLGGSNTPWFVREIPTLAVSFANPYHLIDVPEIRTYINAYTDTEFTIPAVIDKLVGRSDFTGVSPVDPFVGRIDTRF